MSAGKASSGCLPEWSGNDRNAAGSGSQQHVGEAGGVSSAGLAGAAFTGLTQQQHFASSGLPSSARTSGIQQHQPTGNAISRLQRCTKIPHAQRFMFPSYTA